MTIATGDAPVELDRKIGISANADLTAPPRFTGPIIVISGESTSEADLQLAPVQAIITRTVTEFRSLNFVESKSFAVTPDGYDLAVELIQEGLLDPRHQIIWALAIPLVDCIKRLDAIQMPEHVAICAIGGDRDHPMVTTAGGNQFTLDFESFKAGLDVSDFLAGSVAVGTDGMREDSETKQALELLRKKHLSLLEALISIEASKPAEGALSAETSTDASRLENDLILLKRRYDALDRKYTALSNSRLGRLTLQLWERKSRQRGAANSMKDSTK